MIDCRFVYKFKGGGASDSLSQVYKVHAVPQIGQELIFVGNDGNAPTSKVIDVVHYIDRATGTHEITVYYGGD